MKPTFATKVADSVCKWVNTQYRINCSANISSQEECTVTQKLDLDQMSESSIHILKDTNMIKLLPVANFGFICFDPVWMILIIFVICHKLRGTFGCYHLSVCFFFFMLLLLVRTSNALGLKLVKARVNKKGKFPPCGVGKVPPSIIYVGGLIHLENLLFTLCDFVWMFFAKK